MIATAPVYYADNAEARLLEDDRNLSAYVEYMKPKRSIVENDKNYLCKFFIYNGEAADDAEETAAISYFKITQVKEDNFIEDEVDLLRMQAQDEIRAYANFQDDWDGYGAVRPMAECLNHALEIIRNENVCLDYLADIYPNPNGTITLEWEQDDNEIGLEVGSHEFSYFAHFGDIHTYNNKKQYVAEELEKLAGYISILR